MRLHVLKLLYILVLALINAYACVFAYMRFILLVLRQFKTIAYVCLRYVKNP